MKKVYIKPEQQVILLRHRCHIMEGSPFQSLGSNLNENDDTTDDLLWGGFSDRDAR
jgi:hypothetical protein